MLRRTLCTIPNNNNASFNTLHRLLPTFILNISLLLHGTGKTPQSASVVLCGKVHRLGFCLEKGDSLALKLHWSVVDEMLTHYQHTQF